MKLHVVFIHRQKNDLKLAFPLTKTSVATEMIHAGFDLMTFDLYSAWNADSELCVPYAERAHRRPQKNNPLLMIFSNDRIAMWSSPTHVNTSKNCLWWLRGIKVMVYGRSEAMETGQRESGKQGQSGQNQHGRQERHVMAPEPRQQSHVNECLCMSEENRSELFSIAPPLHINILRVQKYSHLLSKNTDQGMKLCFF